MRVNDLRALLLSQEARKKRYNNSLGIVNPSVNFAGNFKLTDQAMLRDGNNLLRSRIRI